MMSLLGRFGCAFFVAGRKGMWLAFGWTVATTFNSDRAGRACDTNEATACRWAAHCDRRSPVRELEADSLFVSDWSNAAVSALSLFLITEMKQVQSHVLLMCGQGLPRLRLLTGRTRRY